MTVHAHLRCQECCKFNDFVIRSYLILSFISKHYHTIPIDSVPPHFRHTLWWVCGGVWSKCGSLPTRPAPWLQGPATKLWHHNLTTKSATFLVGLWCKCGGCEGQLCGGVVVGLWPCTRIICKKRLRLFTRVT